MCSTQNEGGSAGESWRGGGAGLEGSARAYGRPKESKRFVSECS